MEALFTKEEMNKFISGGAAGAVAKCVIAPLDRVKVLFQATTRRFTVNNALLEMIRISREEGIRAFWKGNYAMMLRIIPYSAIQFTTYDYYKKQIFESDRSFSKTKLMLFNFMPGALAGATAVLMTYPFEVTRTRLAIQTTSQVYKGVSHAFWTIGKAEGMKGLFNGFYPTICGIAIYSGVSFSLYFTSKEVIGHSGNLEHFLFGAAAGIIGQLSAYPFDVVRKRMQAHGFIEKVSSFRATHNEEELKSMLSYWKMIVRGEGLRGLFKGFSMNIVKSPIASGIVHTTNEVMNHYFEDYSEKEKSYL
ncbi:SLC25A42_1 [Blepharisma stoltei]|uniref:Mitochondrial carrier protein n=1 Tax=Blepharisma stoltei TaxID=1481888 RepID=A0AAU9IVI6_9CILI|nr:unnamed protein product [Blepharisma stoltei]